MGFRPSLAETPDADFVERLVIAEGPATKPEPDVEYDMRLARIAAQSAPAVDAGAASEDGGSESDSSTNSNSGSSSNSSSSQSNSCMFGRWVFRFNNIKFIRCK